MFKKYKNKVVIVTGSSAGIGAGAAVGFAAEGASVVIHGRNEAALEKVKQNCLNTGGNGKVHIVTGDITKDEIRQKLINETVHVFGKIDVLVNNVGDFNASNFENSTMDVFDSLMNVNVRSLVALTKLAVPHLIESKGNIVNISSYIGMRAVPWATFVAMSKAAVDHFTKCLALELGPKGVRVNAVNPGVTTGTNLFTRSGMTADDFQHFAKSAGDMYPLRRPGTVDDVVKCILFLASENASFVTGMLLPVEGGAAMA